MRDPICRPLANQLSSTGRAKPAWHRSLGPEPPQGGSFFMAAKNAIAVKQRTPPPAKRRSWPASKVEAWKIARIKPYARNPRLHSDAQIRQIANSMTRFGWTMPVLVDEKGELIAGHGRILAGMLLGYDEAPVMIARGWSKEEKIAYRIADNQLTLNAEWDAPLLGSEMQLLHSAGFDMPLLGFPDIKLVSFMAGLGDGGAAGVGGDDEPDQELEGEEKALMIKAWQQLAGDWLEIIEAQKLLSTNFTRGAAMVHFLRARFFDVAVPSAITLAYNPHRALVAYRSGSLADGLRKAVKNEQNFVERLWFVLGGRPRLDTLVTATLPFHDHRIPGEFPIELARDLYNEFAGGEGTVLDPCHGWGGRMVGFLLSDATTTYHGFDTDPRTHAGVEALFTDLRGYAMGFKHAKLTLGPFEDAKLTASSYDFALTSPPYYDTEKYGGEASSWAKYSTFDAWVDGFYKPLIEKTAHALKPGAVFALQVGSQEYPLEKLAREIAATAGLAYVETRLTEMSAKGHVGFHTEGAIDRDRESHEVIVILSKGKPKRSIDSAAKYGRVL